MLHSKKNQAILEWYNSLTTKGNVSSLTQFTDGSLFCDIVASLEQPVSQYSDTEVKVSSESIIFSETSIACNEEVSTFVEEGTTERKMETSVSEVANVDPFVIKDSDYTDTQKKYDIIKKFIDVFYKGDSSSLINYEECQNGKELELAKIAVLLLSAMVINLSALRDATLCNSTFLEQQVQEDIHECMFLVIGENTDLYHIKKLEFHKILSRPANYRGTPVRRQPSRNTADQSEMGENVKNFLKKRKDRTSVVFEEIQESSPLKSFLESPKVQHTVAAYQKERELAKYRKDLLEEETKVSILTLEKRNLCEELGAKNRKLEFYKDQLRSLREEMEEKEKIRIEESNNKKLDEERFRKLVETQKEEIKQLKENNEVLQEAMAGLEKKLEQNDISSILAQSENLKKKVFELEHENASKELTIQSLTSIKSTLENDLKMYRECLPTNRRSTRSSSNVSKIIYADEQAARRSSEKKEFEFEEPELEKKDDEIMRREVKFQQYMMGEGSKNKNPNVESLQSTLKYMQDIVDDFKKDNSELTGRLKYYESKYGQVDWNTVKTEVDSSRSTSNGSELSDIHLAKFDSKMESQLSESSDKELVEVQKSTLSTILKVLENKNCITSLQSSSMKDICSKIEDHDGISTFLLVFLGAIKQSYRPVTTRSRSSVTEEDMTILVDKNKNLEQKLQTVKQELKTARSKITKNDGAFQETLKKSQAEKDELAKEIEKLKKEISVLQENYNAMEKHAKKKEKDCKAILRMYKTTCENAVPKKKDCEECEKLSTKLKELNNECLDYEQETAELRASIKNLTGRLENFQCQVKELRKEKTKLENQLWQETSALSGSTSERDALILHYFKKGADEAAKRAKDSELKKKDALNRSSQPVVNFNTYIMNRASETPVSNSFLSGNIPSGCFRADDEDDFLNHSSLAEIRSGGTTDNLSEENRLQELRRRNTLCPPHLQSSYPMEMENMTPSEKKYFDPNESSINLGASTSSHNERQQPCRPGPQNIKNGSRGASDSRSFFERKRKSLETDRVSIRLSKRQCGTSTNGNQKKSSTPLKRAAAFVRRQSHFKTPQSVHRLMGISRRGKAH